MEPFQRFRHKYFIWRAEVVYNVNICCSVWRFKALHQGYKYCPDFVLTLTMKTWTIESGSAYGYARICFTLGSTRRDLCPVMCAFVMKSLSGLELLFFSHGFKCQIMRGLSPQLNWTYRELIFFISSKHVDPFLLLQLSSLHIVNIIIKQTTNINAANL